MLGIKQRYLLHGIAHPHNLLLSDSSADACWRLLWDVLSEVRRPSGQRTTTTALILHLRRHYALVFGLREFDAEEEEGQQGRRRVRQVLSARRKQKPKTWLDFEEDVLGLLRGEDGTKYQVIFVRRSLESEEKEGNK